MKTQSTNRAVALCACVALALMVAVTGAFAQDDDGAPPGQGAAAGRGRAGGGQGRAGGQGRGQGGASYSWSDTTAQLGETYDYWLVETEVNGTTNEYGPAHALPHTESSAFQLFLPVLLR